MLREACEINVRSVGDSLVKSVVRKTQRRIKAEIHTVKTIFKLRVREQSEIVGVDNIGESRGVSSVIVGMIFVLLPGEISVEFSQERFQSPSRLNVTPPITNTYDALSLVKKAWSPTC